MKLPDWRMYKNSRLIQIMLILRTSCKKLFLYLPSRRALSSVGLEHLPYKQRVVGSNPTEPTPPKVL